MVVLYICFQRKELEDFKERMRVRKEKRLLKNIPLESENWKLHVEENDFPPFTNDTNCLAVILRPKEKS